MKFLVFSRFLKINSHLYSPPCTNFLCGAWCTVYSVQCACTVYGVWCMVCRAERKILCNLREKRDAVVGSGWTEEFHSPQNVKGVSRWGPKKIRRGLIWGGQSDVWADDRCVVENFFLYFFKPFHREGQMAILKDRFRMETLSWEAL